MKRTAGTSIIAIVGVVAIGALVAWAGSIGGSQLWGLPAFAVAVGLAFVVQWVAFIPAAIARTERFFDITGSLTYIGVTLVLVLAAPHVTLRGVLLAVLVVVWALRLGTFLLRRVVRDGGDGRFDEIKKNPLRFLSVWTIQGLWVSLTAAAAWIALSSGSESQFDVFTAVGLVIWLVGFAIEVTADAQKSRFKADPANRGRFITTGLWGRSQHPNYFGEILLWIGVAVIAAPTFVGWQWVGLLSPVIVIVLLTRVSGIPILRQRAQERWGDDPEYQAYVAKTPVLIPRITR